MRIFAYICFGAAGWIFVNFGMQALISLGEATLIFGVVVGFFVGVGVLALRYAENKEEERLDAEFRELDSKNGPNQ